MGQDAGRSQGPAIWRWGFIVGGSAGALGIATAVATLALTTGATLLLDGIVVLLVLALYFAGGLLVARQTGSVGAATLSGVVAGIFSAILREIAAVFVTLSRPLPTLTTTGVDEGTLRAVAIIISVVFILLLFGGLGAGMAALGGIVGRRRSFTPSYPVPYPGMPGYPMPQGYGPPPGYPMPQGYAPPPGYPMPQGYGPPPGYAPLPGYPAPMWYSPIPGMPVYPPPPPPPHGVSAAPGSQTYPPAIYPSPAGETARPQTETPAQVEPEREPDQPALTRSEQPEAPAYAPPAPPAPAEQHPE